MVVTGKPLQQQDEGNSWYQSITKPFSGLFGGAQEQAPVKPEPQVISSEASAGGASDAEAMRAKRLARFGGGRQ